MTAVTDSTAETAILIPGSMAFLQPSGELVLIVEAGMDRRSNYSLISSPGGAEHWIFADHLVPYPSYFIGQYNDDDIKSCSEHAIKQKLIGLFKDGHSLMAVLAAHSDWTGAMAASGGHFDSFGKKAVDSLLESKGVVPLGLPDTTFHPPEPNVPSPAPTPRLPSVCPIQGGYLSLCRGSGDSCVAFNTAFFSASPPLGSPNVKTGVSCCF